MKQIDRSIPRQAGRAAAIREEREDLTTRRRRIGEVAKYYNSSENIKTTSLLR